MSYLCDKCDAQFPKTQMGKQEWLLHRKGHNSPQGVVPETATGQDIKASMSAKEIKQQQAEEKKARKPKKTSLTYMWEGECPTCFGTLDTISIEAGQAKGKIVTVAFCGDCKKEIAHRQVDKL